jgi:DNA-binding IclR family transcriptional regulator
MPKPELSPPQALLLNVLRRHPNATLRELAAAARRPTTGLAATMHSLQLRGLVALSVRGMERRWSLTASALLLLSEVI